MLTVEEARAPIVHKLHRLAEKIAMSSSQPYEEIAEADQEDAHELDDLILAVQAAMPCYTWPSSTEENIWCNEGVELCPSCTARRTLREREAMQA